MIEYETAVTEALADSCEMTFGDASGIVLIHEQTVIDGYTTGRDAADTAHLIDLASRCAA